MNPVEERTYSQSDCITFRKTDEPFGGLSNMAPGFPLVVNGIRLFTSEALYQCCRFPRAPEVQRIIIQERSPITAKMKSKPFRHLTREDWEEVRATVMRWCLRVKLAQNWNSFGRLLLSTKDKAIVEDSSKDQFWGAKRREDGSFVGRNVLGRLLMQLREELKRPDSDTLKCVAPPNIPEFLLLDRKIGQVGSKHDVAAPMLHSSLIVPEDEPISSALSSGEMITLSGDLQDRDWADLIHFLSASGILPDHAHLELEMRFAVKSDQTESKLKILGNIARRFGISYRRK